MRPEQKLYWLLDRALQGQIFVGGIPEMLTFRITIGKKEEFCLVTNEKETHSEMFHFALDLGFTLENIDL